MTIEREAKHTPGPAAEAIVRADAAARDAQIATYTDLRDIAVQAEAFTHMVEGFARAGDGSGPRVPPTEGELADALYALRAAIAKTQGEQQ